MMTDALLKQQKLQNQNSILDDIDRQLIQATQSGLPLVARPYHDIAERLGLDVQDVISRMQTMKQNGIIRRIAAVPNHYALGYKGNGMSVWDVPSELVNELGKKVGALDFVSHSYHRPRFLPEWPYNLFAMVHAHNKDEALLLVNTIADLLGEFDRGHDVLFSKQILKKTGMRLIS